MSKIDKSDPFPGLPRRRFFADLTDGEVVAMPIELPSAIEQKAMAKKIAKALNADLGRVDSVKFVKRGRPKAENQDNTLAATKPWEAEGISRRSWFRKQKAKTDG